MIDFPKNAQDKLSKIYEQKKYVLDRTIRQIALVQGRLPKKLQDYSQYDNLIEDLVALEGKQHDYVYARMYFEDLFVIICGKYL